MEPGNREGSWGWRGIEDQERTSFWVNRGLEGPAMPEVSETSSEWLLMTIQGVRKSLYNVKQESVQFFTKQSSHTESKFPQIDSPRDQTYHISEPSYPPRDANAL